MSKINETNYPRRTQANYADTDMLVIQAAGGNTYTTRLEDMREDYEETLAPTLSALQDDINENLATIEAGSTASKVYAKGDYLVFGGKLCRVTSTSIAAGATLTIGTNIELAPVGDELKTLSSELASKDVSSQFTYSSEVLTNFKALLAGNVLSLYGSTPSRQFVSATAIIAGFPSKYRPKSYIPITLYNTSTNKPLTDGMLWAQPAGSALAYFGDTITGAYAFYAQYLI